MMISAYGGYDLIMKAYKEAIKEKYRFYSYGDAMLILYITNIYYLESPVTNGVFLLWQIKKT